MIYFVTGLQLTFMIFRKKIEKCSSQFPRVTFKIINNERKQQTLAMKTFLLKKRQN